MGAPRVNLSDKVIAQLPQEERDRLGVKTREESNAALQAKDEATLQRMVESWLKHRGYWPRTPAFLDGRTPPKGWYIHLHQTKKNPLVLDLLIIDPWDGRYLELELKTETGVLKDHQQVIVDVDGAKVARSAEEAVEAVKEWENGFIEK